MKRIAPSEQIRKDIDRFLAEGFMEEEGFTSHLLRLGAQRLVQELLEQEVSDFLGRDRYERKGELSSGYRNGYERATIRCAEGKIPVFTPQVRQSETPFRSRLLGFLKGNTDMLEGLVAEMYARGLSTRDIEDAFTDVTGECLISKSAVSEVTESLWEEYEAFAKRDLSCLDVCYLFLDAIYEPLRRHGTTKEGILCAWAILTDGRKVLLHLALGNKESYECWLSFLRDMVSRGLKVPLTITSDGAPGLIRAIEEVFPVSLRVRCWCHKMRNIAKKLPESARADFMAHVRSVRDAATLEAGEDAVAFIIEKYSKEYPSAVACLTDDLEATLNHLKVPANHRINVRTTNLIERSFVEERRRTKVIPRFFDEKSCIKLVFSVLSRASERWIKVRISELEAKQIMLLRYELGLDPKPPKGSVSSREEVVVIA